jgi:formiminotetrahydrofolate cyclodeaminase
MEALKSMTCEQMIAALASKSPVPGGGGASALVGAVGVALGNMVGSLTAGKKKYEKVEADIARLQKEADKLQAELLDLGAMDAEAFEELSAAYKLPTATAKEKAYKAKMMEEALATATLVPLAIMCACGDAIKLHEELEAKGSALAISDVGVGVSCCLAALQGASLNVYSNTKVMTDRHKAGYFMAQAGVLLDEYVLRAVEVFERVETRLK